MDGSTKDIFVSRVQALADSLENSTKETLDGLFTKASLLYHHGVRLASVDIVNESTLQKLRLVVDLLKEQEESYIFCRSQANKIPVPSYFFLWLPCKL